MVVSNLIQRVLVAAVFGPLLVVLFWAGGLPLLGLICLVAGVATWEYCRLQRHKGLHPWTGLGVAASLVCCVWIHRYGLAHISAVFLVLLLVLCLLSLKRRDDAFRVADATATLMGVLYAGFLMGFGLLVGPGTQASGAAPRLGVLVLLAIWATDIAAYFTGRLFGRRHPFPRISPGKTEAGLAGGLIGALAAVAAGHSWTGFGAGWQTAVLGLIIFAGSISGDLFESAVKRDAGVKDSSGIIPGHGGVLDRFDSFLFVFPVVYLYLELLEAIGT